MKDSITTSEDLKKHLGCDFIELPDVINQFPVRINSYILNQIRLHGHPIRAQYVPDVQEIQDTTCIPDPLGEEDLSKTPNLVHKYPDRVLFLVTGQCSAFCRFCTRKRKVGTERMAISKKAIDRSIEYIRSNPTIREVLISGGDPLHLPDSTIDRILTKLRSIPSVEIIRIGSRMPSSLPMRVTPQLVRMLSSHHPLYINTHFNHPAELTKESIRACTMLADAGIPVGCQTVLLRGINDNSKILAELFCKLLRIRVKPYYLFQGDLTRGTNHFRTTTKCGIQIMQELYGHISGMAIPIYALDAPGGKGKIPLTPNYLLQSGRDLVFRNFRGEVCSYPEPVDSF
ncbi:KamA family radical SAM protein [Desulfopila sp. IMCC35008]|uniref:KamA family radical SAM protein n=1 Tax=Desulfopila sp. IMCC35008 TaxID=2653858 RepID=UPI001F10473E|nr:KamA family radical SAM protein [Desulfopila sp. IMCC35008]